MGYPAKQSVECPDCGCRYCPVSYTRHATVTVNGVKRSHTRRARICQHCGRPFTTIETLEDNNNPGMPDVPPSNGFSPEKTENPYL